ncbi:MAG: magnesium transporter CorA family protein [Rhizomicrobium sp.]
MLNFYPSSEHPLWIDLFNPTDSETQSIAKALDIEVPARADLEAIESSSRLQSEGAWIRVSTPVSAHGEYEGTTPVGFVLSPKVLVTVRYTELQAFDATAKACNKSEHPLTGSAEVFASLIEGMIDYGADMLEQIGNTLNTLSSNVFHEYRTQKSRSIRRKNRELKGALLEIGSSGNRLSQIREALLGLQRIIPFVSEKAKGWAKPEVQARLKTVSGDLVSLADFEVHLSNKIQFLLDATLGFINTEQNDIFKVLTIVTVVGIPPTFFASMWGMNFHDMPEYSWSFGYEFGLFVIIVSTLVPIIWFKWRGWW